MIFKVPQRLESKRLIIRPFKREDLDAFYSFMHNENVAKYLLFSGQQKTFEESKELLEQTIDNYDGPNQIYALAIADKKKNEFIGSLGLRPDFDAPDQQIFWSLVPGLWGKGLATEAVELFIDFAFSKLGLKKIVAYSHPDNTPSANLAKKIGMKSHGPVTIEGLEYKPLYFTIEK